MPRIALPSMGRRYGNRPGLVANAVLLVAVGILLPTTSTWLERSILVVLGTPLLTLGLWHWRSYRDEGRLLLERPRARRGGSHPAEEQELVCGPTVGSMSASDGQERRYLIARGDPIAVEIRGTDGTRLLVRGVIDGVPEAAGRIAQKIVIRDAVARALP